MARNNIINKETGALGYAVPGQTLNPGWDWSAGSNLAPAVAPTNVADIGNPSPMIQIPETKLSEGNPYGAMANTAGISKGLDTAQGYADQQFKLIESQQAANKENQSWLKSLITPPADATQTAKDALSAAGLDPIELMQKKYAAIEENNTLNKQYAALKAQKDKELDAIQNSEGMTVSGVTSALSVAEKNANIRLNEMSAKINANNGYLNALQGEFTQATDYIKQASTEALANNKYYTDLFSITETQNKELFSAMSSTYKEAWNIAKADADQQYQENKDAHDSIVALFESASKAGAPASTLQYLAGLISKPTLNQSNVGAAFSQAGAYAGGVNPATNALPAGYTGEFASTIDLVSNTGTTDKDKGFIKNKMENFVANQDYGSAYALLTQQAGESLKGTAGTKFQGQVQNLNVLPDMRKAIQAYADAGGKTDIFKGTADKIQSKIGALYTDPKYAGLAVQLDAAFQNYRSLMTGAAFGAKESADYASILPSKYNTLDLNLAKLSGAEAYMNSAVDGSLKGQFGQGAIYIKQKANGAVEAPADPNASKEVQGARAKYNY